MADVADRSSRQDTLLLAVDGRAATVLAIADTAEDDSVAAIAALHRLDIDVVMTTGDNARTAAAVARQVGIRRVVVGDAIRLRRHRPTPLAPAVPAEVEPGGRQVDRPVRSG